jgi:hypothetical protein
MWGVFAGIALWVLFYPVIRDWRQRQRDQLSAGILQQRFRVRQRGCRCCQCLARCLGMRDRLADRIVGLGLARRVYGQCEPAVGMNGILQRALRALRLDHDGAQPGHAALKVFDGVLSGADTPSPNRITMNAFLTVWSRSWRGRTSWSRSSDCSAELAAKRDAPRHETILPSPRSRPETN